MRFRSSASFCGQHGSGAVAELPRRADGGVKSATVWRTGTSTSVTW